MRPADAAYRVVGDRVVPDWLGPTDHPWLRDLLDRAAAAEGGTVAALEERLAAPLPRAAPPRRLTMAREVVRGLVTAQPPPREPPPRALREAVFLASAEGRAGTDWSRERSLAVAAARLGVAAAALEEGLFADLPEERLVRLPEPLPDPAGLAARVNAALAACLCARAATLRVRAWGNARDLVRHLRLRGLLFVARALPDGYELAISGPTSLFRRTTLYGRAYASVLPRLPWCERFELSARVAVRGGEAELRLGPSDPVWPSAPPRRFDSVLEARFAADLAKRHPGWELVREPAPVEVDGSCWFPDFALGRGDRRWFVEIVGFWTPEYLAAKLARLRRAEGAGWVICVDERLDCGVGELPPSVHVVPFRRRIPVEAVIAAAEATLPRPGGSARAPAVSLPPTALFADWAGRRRAADPLHARLSALGPGAEVGLRDQDGRLVVIDGAGLAVAALSARASAEWRSRLPDIARVVVRTMVERTAADTHPDWRGALRVDRWRVPLVEVHLRS